MTPNTGEGAMHSLRDHFGVDRARRGFSITILDVGMDDSGEMDHVTRKGLGGEDVGKEWVIIAVADKVIGREVREFKFPSFFWSEVVEVRDHGVRKGDWGTSILGTDLIIQRYQNQALS